MANVSCASVSRAINNSGKLSPETRQRILDICEREGFFVNSHARSLTQNHSNVLGLIMPNVSNAFFSEITLAVELYAYSRGYNVMPCNSLYDEKRTSELFSFLIGQQVDGIILLTPQIDSMRMLKQFSRLVPTVMLGGAYQEEDFSDINTVGIDNRMGGKIAAEYLLSLGHRDIAYVGYRKTGLAQVHRFHGFLQVCREHGIEPYVLENADSRSSIEAGYRLGVELLEKGPKVTAAFAATDYTALGVLKACGEHGLAVPDDLSLMGFDNTLVSSLPRIELTTVDQKKDVMAKAAVDTLIGIINADGSAQYGRHVILPSLIERNTCRPLER